VGVETTTGPLGQGLGASVGNGDRRGACWRRGSGRSWSTTNTYVVAGDGCLMEGISHEAIDLAGHLRGSGA